ncbi:MAG TPA: hypothetical protein DEP45_03590 [Armatimonadetes bacterium]|nr:hypothetical protein [Armatimonadota bacterium]
MSQPARHLEDARPPQPTPRSYDFRTGSELSREALSQLRAHAERLATALGRIMTAYLGAPVRFEAQAAAGESSEKLVEPRPGHPAFALVGLNGNLPPMVWEVDQELVGPVICRMLGGPAEPIERPVTVLEAALLRRFVQEMMDVWRTSWEHLSRREPTVTEVLTEAVQLRGKLRSEELVVVTLAAEVAGAAGLMRVALPVATAQRLLCDEAPEDEPAPLNMERLRQRGEHIVVPITVELHRTRISLSEATRLGVGDLIPLGKPTTEPMTVCVRGRPKFLAETGISNGRLAAKLIGHCRG